MSDIYITSIECHNWQSHADTVVHLVNGINAFIGSSNSGKTSLFRSIRWVLENRPGGDKFIRKGQSDCWVALNLSNGYRIKRRRTRSSGINTYEIFLNGVPTLEHPLTGFGNDVPHEVREACGYIDLENNYAKQLEGPFLVSAKPKARAEAIGDFEELQRVDRALQGINEDITDRNKTLRLLRAEVKTQEKRAADLQKEISRRGPVVQELSSSKAEILRQEGRVTRLHDCQMRLEDIARQVQEQQEIIVKADRILLAWNDDLPVLAEKVQRLERILSRLHEIAEERKTIRFMSEESLNALSQSAASAEHHLQKARRLSAICERLEQIGREREEINKSFSPVIAAIDTTPLDTRIASFRHLEQIHKRLLQISDEKIQAKRDADRAEQEIERLLDDLVSVLHTARICPVCAQNTEHLSHEHVQSSI